jgi:hypothetical protein
MLIHLRPYRLILLYTLILALLIALLALLLTSDTAAAQTPVSPAHSDPNWEAAYWDNTDLSGSPVLVPVEPALEHNWDTGSPDPRVPSDYFSARWLRYIDIAAGVYRFTTSSDDGLRVYVDDQLIIDQWYVHAEETFTADIELSQGHHLLRVEYFEYAGKAVAKVRWQPLIEVTTGAWRGQYYDNRSLDGEPAFVRHDETIDFVWSGSPRSSELGADNFSVRWTRSAYFIEGRYRFRVTVDDGARLWVNGHLLIDQWFDQAPTNYTEDIYLPNGNIPLQFEFFEHEGGARARLTWEQIENPLEEHDWRGEYFNNDRLSGTPVLVRLDPNIHFNWGAGSPASSLDQDYFSARWTRTSYFAEDRYRFTTETDDGVRLYIDNELVIDQWQCMARTQYSARRSLTRGNHTIRMEYFEATGNAFAKLSWERIEEEEDEEPVPVGNIITCVPPQPAYCAWIKVYRLDSDGSWIDISQTGYASWVASGYLKIDGLLVDVNTFGQAGHPYRVEQWVDGQLKYSTGNFQAGEPSFLVRPFADNYTPWQCSP